jgi:hypothetical protein
VGDEVSMRSDTIRCANAQERSLDLAHVTARVVADHRALRGLLDEVEQAAAAAKTCRIEGLDRLHRAVWELYLAVDEHLVLEERDLAPIFAARRPCEKTGLAR